MSALDFPDDPAVGDLYGSSSTVWRWNGTLWESTSGASGPRGLVASLVMPIGPIIQTAGMVNTTIVEPQTVQVQAGRRYLITFTLRAVTPAPAGAVVSEVWIDNVSQGEQWTWVQGSNQAVHLECLWIPTTSGAHTISTTMKGWSIGFTAYTNPPGVCLIEDISYEAGTPAISTQPIPWITATMAAGWSHYAGGRSPTQYRKVGDMVHLRVSGSGGGTAAVGSAMFNLPVGYRPPGTLDVYGRDGNPLNTSKSVLYNIEPGGDVKWYGSAVADNLNMCCWQHQFSITP